MSQPLISRSPDLQRLQLEGYDIRVYKGHLLMTVPYVDAQRQVREGTLVTNLCLSGHATTTPSPHTIWFIGEHPCDKNGTALETIRHSEGRQQLADGLVVDRQFSNKPKEGYPDYYAKMSMYAAIIGHPAESLDPSTQICTHRVRASDDDPASPFAYPDTASTRASIAAATEKLATARVAIVGLGGTGSYVLDLLAKCPVGEIHLFDGDRLLQHNAFRSPGAPSEVELHSRPMKVDWFASIYSKMHLGIRAHAYFLHEGNRAELDTMDFVFLCIDRNDVRAELIDALVRSSVPFVDAGMGITVDAHSQLGGILRITTVTPQQHVHAHSRIPHAADTDDGLYVSNIQVADLNCMSAALAVQKWKKCMGFYRDLEHEHHTTYTIDTHMLLGEERSPVARDSSCAEQR